MKITRHWFLVANTATGHWEEGTLAKSASVARALFLRGRERSGQRRSWVAWQADGFATIPVRVTAGDEIEKDDGV